MSHITAKHSDHMNITESRKHAVKLMTRHTGLAYFLNGSKSPKCRIITAIKSGLFDGYFYQVDWTDSKRVNISSFNANNYLHKIGV